MVTFDGSQTLRVAALGESPELTLKWAKKFVENLYTKNNEPLEVPDIAQGDDICIEFIDKTVELFCKEHNFATKIINHLERENQ